MKLFTAFLVVGGLFWYLRLPSYNWPLTNSKPIGETLVAFGDSLTLGYQMKSSETYPAQLAELIGEDVINVGKNGDTTKSALERLKRDVLDQDPRIVLITLGGNDIIRQLPIEETIKNLRSIFGQIQDHGALVVYLSISPPLVHKKRLEQIRDLCQDMGVLYVNEIMDGLWGKSDLMYDSIHPNAAGYQIMSERVYRRIEHYLD